MGKQSRRSFLKNTALLTAGSGFMGGLTASIQKALAIEPAAGSTYQDAEHVVILMQENRSFDHAYGALRGVRGFNDPRAMTLPDGKPVWLQTNPKGAVYAPFRLNLLGTKATWMGSLPHTRDSQVAARNHGKHDRWLEAKRSDDKKYADLPLTLGYYNREDLPFYYALADAFTICDQNFCSALSCTTPNRLYLWSGKLRDDGPGPAPARMTNEETDFDHEASWTTFPERLEAAGISWRVYQNEIDLATGLKGEADAWLANFGDNPLEYFTQYGVRFAPARRQYRQNQAADLAAKLKILNALNHRSPDQEKQRATWTRELAEIQAELEKFSPAAWAKLSASQQKLHQQAFTTNVADPHYRSLETLKYETGHESQSMPVPQGDVLHQFRADVTAGKLPTVSWLVPPERFSDHPSSPWYGAWYLSEVFNILTKNPDVWRKTVFILCYDENDGYFDHVPPFMPPQPGRPDTGQVTAGIDTSVEQVKAGQLGDPIGLGYRVPLVIASPWTRGGFVCSQTFDHTSILQWLETFLSHKTGHTIREENISRWRRAVCGDLTAGFRPYHGEPLPQPQTLERDPYLEAINQARHQPVPANFQPWTPEQIQAAATSSASQTWRLAQEPGVRPACALPYELVVQAKLDPERKALEVVLAAENQIFGRHAAGTAFRAYVPGLSKSADGSWTRGRNRNYAVEPGGRLTDHWSLADFADGQYLVEISGPNGFYRSFQGSSSDPALEILWSATGKLRLTNHGATDLNIALADQAYGNAPRTVDLKPGQTVETNWDLAKSFGWYDLSVRVTGATDFHQRLAGHVENGQASFSDPAMGRVS
ncbi:MAG TPA: phospholipase C, phosphocholine-specific [Verrucomicrobiae bacterium]